MIFKESVDYIYFLSMIRVQKKVSTGLKVLQYYTTKIWVFNNSNLRNLREKLNDHDKAVFNFDIRPVRKISRWQY